MRTLAVAGLSALLSVAAQPLGAADLDLGMLAGATVLLPKGPAAATVFLFSGSEGWSDTEQGLARDLARKGTAVVGIDLPSYLGALNAADGECVYTVSDIERIGHQIGRTTGSAVFTAPVIAGRGAGGALVLDILAQTPDATLGAAVAVDPAYGVNVAKRLCTPADLVTTPEGASYVLPAGNQPAPLNVVESVSAGSDTRARVHALTDGKVAFSLTRADQPPELALAAAVDAALAAAGATAGDLPVVELAAPPAHDTMAIILSGDGGWRDLDKSIGEALQAQGVPTIGFDSLRYFWSKRSPAETAKALARLIDIYTARWNVKHVVLIGYSFGASVLPAAYVLLPPATEARISQISLLGIATSADWEISVAGWLGATSASATPTGAALAALPAARVQCFYGKDDSDSACPGLAGTGAEVFMTPGGHHFDGNYTALAQHILDGLDRRRAAGSYNTGN